MPVRFSAEQFGGRDDEAAAGVGGDQIPRALHRDEQGGDFVLVRQFRQQAHRLAVAAAARQVGGLQREGLAVGRQQRQPVGRLTGQQQPQLVAFLEFQLCRAP